MLVNTPKRLYLRFTGLLEQIRGKIPHAPRKRPKRGFYGLSSPSMSKYQPSTLNGRIK